MKLAAAETANPVAVNDRMFQAAKRIVKQCLRVARRLGLAASEQPAPCPVSRALQWLREAELPSGGIRVHRRHRRAYPEVTGYLIPTLLDWQEFALAERAVRWLIRIQGPDGAFCDPDRKMPYVFDTAQAMRGLLAGRHRVPDAAQAAHKAAQYIVSQMIDGGRGGFPPQFGWYEAPPIPETILLYVLPALESAAEVLGQPQWTAAARECLDYYSRHPALLDMTSLTHFLGYELEALVDLGRAHIAQGVLDRLAQAQREDGAVRAAEGVDWVCVPGLAQLAVCWYKLGQREPADRAMNWLKRHQRRSGGFVGSVGRGATYFPKREIPWAVKYFLDAERLRARSSHES